MFMEASKREAKGKVDGASKRKSGVVDGASKSQGKEIWFLLFILVIIKGGWESGRHKVFTFYSFEQMSHSITWHRVICRCR